MPGLAARDACVLYGDNKNGNMLSPLAGNVERMRHCNEAGSCHQIRQSISNATFVCLDLEYTRLQTNEQ